MSMGKISLREDFMNLFCGLVLQVKYRYRNYVSSLMFLHLPKPLKENICYTVELFHFNGVEASVLDSAIRTANDNFMA